MYIPEVRRVIAIPGPGPCRPDPRMVRVHPYIQMIGNRRADWCIDRMKIASSATNTLQLFRRRVKPAVVASYFSTPVLDMNLLPILFGIDSICRIKREGLFERKGVSF